MKSCKPVKFQKIILSHCDLVVKGLSEYPWVTPLKNKKGITITNVFQKIIDEFNFEPGKT